MRTVSQVLVETQAPICYRHHRVVNSQRQLGRRTRDPLAGGTAVLIHGSAIKTLSNAPFYNHLRISNRRYFAPQTAQNPTQNRLVFCPRKLRPAQKPSEFDHANTRFEIRSSR
jgi:hypothetical protein